MLECLVSMSHSYASLCASASFSQTEFSRKHNSDIPIFTSWSPERHQKEKNPSPVVLWSKDDFCGINTPTPASFKLPRWGHWMGSKEERCTKGSPEPVWAGASRCEPAPGQHWVHCTAYPSIHMYQKIVPWPLVSRDFSEEMEKEINNYNTAW